MNSEQTLQAINILLAGARLLKTAGVNYAAVIEAQQAAEAEGRELNDAERQQFIDAAQAAVDRL